MEALRKHLNESDFSVYVKTSDRFGAGTDATVFIVLIDKNQVRSERRKLDSLFRNDFERNNLDKFTVKTQLMEDITEIEIWRTGGSAGSAWHLEYVSVQNMKTNESVVFPFHRWLDADVRYMIEAYDCSLPQHCKFVDQRDFELERRRELYQYKQTYPSLPLQVHKLPVDDSFSDKYFWNLSSQKLSLMMEKLWVGIVEENKNENFKSIDDVINLFDKFPSMPFPKGVERWKEDAYFGDMRLNGCNPKLITLCNHIPLAFAVDPEVLEPLLEGKRVLEAIRANRMFLIDLTILEGVSTIGETWLTNPYCLLYLNDGGQLLPVAIQLYKQPSSINPVFYPSDDSNLWLLAKMWFCLADSSFHQAASHLGSTHLLMEGVCVAVNKTMSLSHPIHKLLAPHFLFLLAINDRALSKLVGPGGWIDQTMAIGRIGVFEIVGRRFSHFDISNDGDLMANLKRRGVDDETILPGYHYRDDAIVIYDIIKNYSEEMVKAFYKTEQDIIDDVEIQAWGKELVTMKPDGLGFQGVPGDGKFTKHEHLVSLMTYIIFTCSAEHAAVNFSQYDSYAFPPAYPVKMLGKPPSNKNPVTVADLTKTLSNKEHMMNTMLVTKILSERGTRALGDFEVVYHHRPDIVAIADKFRAELKLAREKISRRDAARKVPYLILNPAEVPNAISV